MTHSELFAQLRHPAWPEPGCAGQVVAQGEYPDDVFDGPGGTARRRTVTLHHCRGCGRMISSADGGILNVYQRREPLPLAVALAEAAAGVKARARADRSRSRRRGAEGGAP